MNAYCIKIYINTLTEIEKIAKLFVITGPSGVGKGTLLKHLLKNVNDCVFSVSYTTRKPRPGEVDSVNYFFVDKVEFEEAIKNNEFLEWAQYNGNYYGTSKVAVEESIKNGKSVILEIETQGAINVMNSTNDCVSVFILPPSNLELEKRLRGRQTEDEETILKRLKIMEFEISLKDKYKYVVINDNIEEASAQLTKIFKKELSC